MKKSQRYRVSRAYFLGWQVRDYQKKPSCNCGWFDSKKDAEKKAQRLNADAQRADDVVNWDNIGREIARLKAKKQAG